MFDAEDTLAVHRLLEEFGGWPLARPGLAFNPRPLEHLLGRASQLVNSWGVFLSPYTSPIIDVHVREDVRNNSRNVLTVSHHYIKSIPLHYTTIISLNLSKVCMFGIIQLAFSILVSTLLFI